MKRYQKAAVSIAFLTAVLSAGLTPGYAIADNGSTGSDVNYSQAQAILETFESDDFDRWQKSISGDSELNSLVSKKDFERFIAARQAARSGDYNTAIKIANRVETSLKEKIG